MLDFCQAVFDVHWQIIGKDHADDRIQFIDIAQCLDFGTILAHTPAAGQTRFTSIPGFGINFGCPARHVQSTDKLTARV